MTVDSQNNMILSGTFRGSLDFDPGSGIHTETAPGSDEYGFIAKYNPEGDLLWVHTYKSYLRGNTARSAEIGKKSAEFDAYERRELTMQSGV